ncbi:MAG: T9SS type A sorting domain-containing protein [Bacteroidetes bacterium]|nr:T9SS type A sorting domain-containing protein [Bacteroidota bacterium]
MKYILTLAFLILMEMLASAQVHIGASNYSTLKAAFDAINNGLHTDSIVITIDGNTTETVTAALNASGSGTANYTSVIIYPVNGNHTISGTIQGAAIIDLNGADNVRIDGRENASGSTASLSIINTLSGSAPGTSTIRFINDATENQIRYCTIKGSSMDVNAGVIYFSTGTLIGNDRNTIEFCNLSSQGISRPSSLVFSLGSAGASNDSIRIEHNNFYNFFTTNGSTYGILAKDYTASWIIAENSFYETSPYTLSTGNYTNYSAIHLDPKENGGGFLVDHNFIGGSQPECGGTPFSTNLGEVQFRGIYLHADTNNLTSIQNNRIANIHITRNSLTTMFYGIYCVDGRFTIGTGGGNQIGSISNSDSIYLQTAHNNGSSTVIYTNAFCDQRIENNIIRGISTDVEYYSSYHYAHLLQLIVADGYRGICTIQNNLLGSLDNPNSIQCLASAEDGPQNLGGIKVNANEALIAGNILAGWANMGNYTTSQGNTTHGIGTLGAGNNRILNNVIKNIATRSWNSNADENGDLLGIYNVSTGPQYQVISGNKIDSLYNQNGLIGASVTGIYARYDTTGIKIISGNFIQRIASPIAGNAYLTGISIRNSNQDTLECFNNVINIGADVPSNSNIRGVYEIGSFAAVNHYFFNTINISGSVTGTSTRITAAFYCSSGTSIRTLWNNIFENTRTQSSAGPNHYAVYFTSATNMIIDYNNYRVTGTGGNIGFLTVNAPTFTDWQNTSGQDLNSLNLNPAFGNPSGTQDYEYIATTTMHGTSATGITTDYFGAARGTPPQIGAFETTCFPIFSTLNVGICQGENYSFGGSLLTQSGVYSDSLISSLGCDSIIILTLTVHPLPLPIVIAVGETLSTQVFTTYQWMMDGDTIPGAMQSSWIALTDGFYSVLVTDANGCSALSDTVQMVGVKLHELRPEQIQFWPNPVRDFLYMNKLAGEESAVMVYNSMGQIQKNIRISESIVDVSGLTPGIYFLLMTHERNYTFIKE